MILPTSFQCGCCTAGHDSIQASQPDVCILYQLHLECGKLINLYDWLQVCVSPKCRVNLQRSCYNFPPVLFYSLNRRHCSRTDSILFSIQRKNSYLLSVNVAPTNRRSYVMRLVCLSVLLSLINQEMLTSETFIVGQCTLSLTKHFLILCNRHFIRNFILQIQVNQKKFT